VLEFEENEIIFKRGEHDCSIMFVSSGAVSIAAFHEEVSFTNVLHRDDSITSSIALLRAIFGVQDELFSKSFSNVINALEATAVTKTTILKIDNHVLQQAMSDFPENQFHLAQVSLSQLERVTIKSLLDYFGLVKYVIRFSILYLN